MNSLLNQLEPFEGQITQDQIEREIVREDVPFGTINDPYTPITFLLPISENEMLNVQDTILRWRVSFEVKGANGANPDWDKVCPVNMLMHSMIKNIDLEINGKLVTSSSQYYPYLVDLQTKLRITDDTKKGMLTNAGYYKDGSAKDSIVTDRRDLIKPSPTATTKSKKVGFASKLFVDLFSQPKLLVGGITVKITIYPHLNPKFYFMCTDDSYTITPKIEECTLFTTRSIIKPDVRRKHLEHLARAPLSWIYTRNEIKTVQLAKGTSEVRSDNLVLGDLPRRVFMCMVKHDTFSGSNYKNPFNYENFGLNYLQLMANDVNIPTRPYQPDFDNSLYERAYNSVYEALNDMNSDSCYTMSYKDFKDGNMIVGFNLSSDTSDGQNVSGYTNPVKSGNLRMDFKFSKALEQNVTIILWMQYDAVLSINKDFQVFTNFN